MCYLLALDHGSRSVEVHIVLVLTRRVGHEFVLIVHWASGYVIILRNIPLAAREKCGCDVVVISILILFVTHITGQVAKTASRYVWRGFRAPVRAVLHAVSLMLSLTSDGWVCEIGCGSPNRLSPSYASREATR